MKQYLFVVLCLALMPQLGMAQGLRGCDCPYCLEPADGFPANSYEAWFMDRWHDGHIEADVSATNVSTIRKRRELNDPFAGVHEYRFRSTRTGAWAHLKRPEWVKFMRAETAPPPRSEPAEEVIDSRSDPSVYGDLDEDELPPWAVDLSTLDVPHRVAQSWLALRKRYPNLRFTGAKNSLSSRNVDERFETIWKLIRAEHGTNLRPGYVPPDLKRKRNIKEYVIADDPVRVEIVVTWRKNNGVRYIKPTIRPGYSLRFAFAP